MQVDQGKAKHPSSSFVCSGNLNNKEPKSISYFQNLNLTRDTEIVCDFVCMIIEKISYFSFCDNTTSLKFCYCKVFNDGKELCGW